MRSYQALVPTVTAIYFFWNPFALELGDQNPMLDRRALILYLHNTQFFTLLTDTSRSPVGDWRLPFIRSPLRVLGLTAQKCYKGHWHERVR